MEVNLRVDDRFVEDENWREASERYMRFLRKNIKEHILFFELGVGMKHPHNNKISVLENDVSK